ncbi:hypothetical protein C8Q76DRAFT_692064 [Earliella scabrosa]|nr:hypothetical protein C8Q76DRAFT_692064 [Earliella scabrosa]
MPSDHFYGDYAQIKTLSRKNTPALPATPAPMQAPPPAMTPFAILNCIFALELTNKDVLAWLGHPQAQKTYNNWCTWYKLACGALWSLAAQEHTLPSAQELAVAAETNWAYLAVTAKALHISDMCKALKKKVPYSQNVKYRKHLIQSLSRENKPQTDIEMYIIAVAWSTRARRRGQEHVIMVESKLSSNESWTTESRCGQATRGRQQVVVVVVERLVDNSEWPWTKASHRE